MSSSLPDIVQSRFARYLVVGGFSATLDFVVFTILVYGFDQAPSLSTAIGVAVGITTSFALNRRVTFATTDRVAVRYIRFATVGIMGLLLSVAVVWLLSEHGSLSPLGAKILSLPFVLGLQFTLNSRWTFA